jgi:hypothetical protein
MNRPNQLMRIMERLGFYDAGKLDLTTKQVFRGFAAFVRHHTERKKR